MLTINETVDKLYKQPERFEQCMDAGDYCLAKWCFINTVFVSSFIELDQEAESRLQIGRAHVCLGCLRKKK